jgi:Cdc6-like AAA superfamily ATPase
MFVNIRTQLIRMDALKAKYVKALDPSKAPVVADIIAFAHKTFGFESATATSDWLDNEILGFWSPGYRNQLNKAGKKIFDRVSADIRDPSYPVVRASSIDRIVLFLFGKSPTELDAFLASQKCQQSNAARKTSCQDNIYGPTRRTQFIEVVDPMKQKKKQSKQKGGANTNVVVLVYIKALRYPSRVQLVRDILKSVKDIALFAQYTLKDILGPDCSIPDVFFPSDEVQDTLDFHKIFRFLLSLRTDTLKKILRVVQRKPEPWRVTL